MLQNIEPETLFEELGQRSQGYTIRAYECSECTKTWSEIIKRSSSIKKKCPECKTNTLESILFCDSIGYQDKAPRTIGTQAERNQKRDKEKYNDFLEESAKKKEQGRKKLGIPERPKWMGEAPKDLANYTTEQQKDYLLTGKTR